MLLNIVQWNARSLRSNKGDLEQFMHQQNIHMALISETWLKNTFPFNIPGYCIIRKDRLDGYGGVAIVLKRSLIFQELPVHAFSPEIEYTGITLNMKNNFKLNFYVLYKKPQATINSVTWRSMLESLEKPFLLGGDFNCHHLSWGSSFSDRCGLNLLDAVEETNLVILNDGSPTRLSAPGGSLSAIDLSICSPSIASLFDWIRTDDTLGSDHYVLLIQGSFPGFHSNTSVTMNAPQRWNLKLANWKLFHDKMNFLTFNASLNSDLSYNTFITNLSSACIASIPKVITTTRNCFKKSWWTDECKSAIFNRKQSMYTYDTNPNMGNFLNYKKQLRLLRK